MHEPASVLVPESPFRFDTYRRAFEHFLKNHPQNYAEFYTLLTELKYTEPAMALAQAIYNVVARDGIPIRPSLTQEFESHMRLALFFHFESDRREDLTGFFLVTNDRFFAKATESLLFLFRDDPLTDLTAFTACYECLLALINGAKAWLTIPRLGESTAIHAFLFVNDRAEAAHMEHGLPGEQVLTHAHRVMAELVASAVLKEPSRTVTAWHHAFGYYAGSARWKAYMMRCRHAYKDTHVIKKNKQLNNTVKTAFRDAQRASSPMPPIVKSKSSIEKKKEASKALVRMKRVHSKSKHANGVVSGILGEVS